MSEMSEQKRRQKTPAGDCQRKIEYLERSDKDAERRDDKKRGKTVSVKLKRAGGPFLFVSRHESGFQYLPLLRHIRFKQLRYKLDEDNYADNAEKVRYAVADGYKVLKLGRNSRRRGFRRRKRRSARKRAGQKPDEHSRKLFAVKSGEIPSDKYARGAGKTARKNEHERKHDVRFKISFKV